MPPTGSTFPRSVISPVMAVFLRTLRCVIAEAIDVAMVIPADGPSFGVALLRHMDVDVPLFEEPVVDAEAVGMRLYVFQSYDGTLLHHVSEVSRQR